MTMMKRTLEEESDSKETKKPKPRATYPCILGKDKVTGRFIFPTISKDDVMDARLFLKNNDLKTFLEYFLPVEVNSIYIYFMIKMLGFDVKDKELFMSLNSNITSNKERKNSTVALSPRAEDDNGDGLTDPLEKKYAVKLIKDLQKAINKVLSTRLRLPNFNTIDHLTATLHNAQKILVLTGAGVSTSLGIPDFRSSEGFYSKIRHLGLEDPQDVFNLDIFLQDPSVFYNIAHMVLPPENMYSPLHSFIKMLQDKGKLLRNYTQNIDNLESYAGIDPDKLVQCHGSFATASCVTCHWQIPGEKIFDNIRNLELPLCPYCYQKRKQYFPMTNGNNTMQTNTSFNSTILKSYGVLKPDMTFFGEALPSRFHKTIRKDILECDLLICIGTSLKVAPVSEIVNMVPSHVPQILINRDMVTHAEFDLNLLGFCDDVASFVAKKCNWDIPHKKWEDLKKIDYNCTEVDKGTYEIKKQPRKKKQ